MSAPAAPEVSRRPSLPLIWVVPIIALLIAGWMLFRQFKDRGPEIAIEFSNGAGIAPGQTELMHKGVAVGTVRSVDLKPDLSRVIVRVRLTKAGAGIAREGSQFWIVHPEVSLSGIRGLETLVSGVQLNVRPGSGRPVRSFRGLDQPPPIEDRDSGQAFILRDNQLNGLRPGSAVHYRGVKVGSVETTRLSDDAAGTLIRIRIYTPYVPLIRTNTQFWNAGGVDFSVGLHGVDMHADSIQSLFGGAVAFATPDAPSLAPPALEGTEFALHAKPQKEWLEWHPSIPIAPLESLPERADPTERSPVGLTSDRPAVPH